jgi:haloalkane dehalogenase
MFEGAAVQVLRTPEDRFEGLAGWDHEPRYADVGGLRMHYVQAGPHDGQVVLLLHGEPTWSYLYRHMIPPIAAAGHLVLAPDLIGFGRSDKPAELDDHSYSAHVRWVADFLADRGAEGITLVCQDWGGLIGLRLVAERGDLFRRVVAANTGLPTGEQRMTEAFTSWQRFAQETDQFPVGQIVNGGCTSDLDEAVIAAYDAPFPDETYKAGPRVLPSLVPTTPDTPGAADNRRAWQSLAEWDGLLLTAFSDSDPITRGGERPFRQLLPAAAGQPHTVIEGAGHFLQEDAGEALAAAVNDFIAST